MRTNKGKILYFRLIILVFSFIFLQTYRPFSERCSKGVQTYTSPEFFLLLFSISNNLQVSVKSAKRYTRLGKYEMSPYVKVAFPVAFRLVMCLYQLPYLSNPYFCCYTHCEK